NGQYYIPRVGHLNSNFSTPVAPPDRLKNIKQIVAAPEQACAIVESGKVVCWGQRTATWSGQTSQGMLGDGVGGSENFVRPKYVRSETGTGDLTDIVQLSASWTHFCGVKSNGSAVCWGGNTYGQI